LKIGLLSYRSHPYSGGQGIYVKHLSKALSDIGHDVSVLSGPPYPELDNSVELIEIPSLGLFETEDRMKAFSLDLLLNPLNLYEWLTVMSGGFPEPYTYGKRVLKYLKENNRDFDIILDNQSLCDSLLEIQKIYPLAVTIHHPITKDLKLEIENASNWKEKLSSLRWHNFLPMQKKVAPKLNKIICVSRPSKKDIVEEFLVDPEKIEVILNGIDIRKFIPNPSTLFIENKIITTASADIPLKGLKYLILALPNIIKVFPKTSLTVIGRSPSDSKLRKLITDLSLEDKIAFRSGITEEEIVNLYHSSEIAVIPSLYEGFGFGAGEAMACGIPLISTHSGGLEEVVGDSAVKILPASTEEIESAVIKLFSSPDRKTELSKMGRERMEKMFDWHIAAKSYENAFKEVIRIFKNEHHKI
jgi:glycosyltransferase involved in cell wall biosynthesis|tara:strand:+ start:117 stop:1361 length:1245 start_codon:yes stop_codon:yes gene_type:complete